jgi:hypothetical protein
MAGDKAEVEVKGGDGVGWEKDESKNAFNEYIGYDVPIGL